MRSPNDLVLSEEELSRYNRHLVMPEIGLQGQKKLKAARVLLVGAGGLGSPVAFYLAGTGIGAIGMVDSDAVELPNLHRQILYSTQDVGRPKPVSARERLLGINPNIEVSGYESRLTSQNALEILKDYDIVIDGSDNFPTRYLISDACVLLGKLDVYGSALRFEGQACVLCAPGGPCYRCLYPEPPALGLVAGCAEVGVLGVVPGVVGAIQAAETIKLVVGQGEPLVGRLLLFDALKMRFRELELHKNPQCPICGEHRTIRKLIDYDAFCGVKPHTQD